MHKTLVALVSLAVIGWTSNPCHAQERRQTETARILADWDDTDENVLASLFATGDSRVGDLVKICRGRDQELHAKAFLVLDLIGSPETRACASGLESDDQPVVLGTSDTLSQDDYAKLEELFADERQKKQLACSEEDVPAIDESLSYALILDGSSRSISLLKRMAAKFKACKVEDLLSSEIVVNADALERDARTSAHNLVLESETFESQLRHSVSFIPPELRSNASIRLLARNRQDTRMLVEVSYRSGMKCGSGYYVVLRKTSNNTWNYALIERAWIS